MSSLRTFTDICRICLSLKYNMISLFTNEQHVGIEIHQLIMNCAPIKIDINDKLPQNICRKCSHKALQAYSFKKLCEESDSFLRQKALSDKYNGEDDVEIKSPNLFEDGAEIRKPLSDESTIFKLRSDEIDELVEENQNDILVAKKCEILDKSSIKEEDGFTLKNNSSSELETSNQSDLNELETNNQLDEKDSENNSSRRKRFVQWTCDICDRTFKTNSALKRHKQIHEEKPFLCHICGKKFSQTSYLKIHSFTHTGEKPYICEICNKSFSAPGTLVTHIRTHTGERPHVCNICGKHFSQSGYLTTHLRTHTGEKPIECEVCHRRFTQSGRLSVHMRIHSGEKPFKCDKCSKSFAIKGTLKKHYRIHTGEKPYRCKVCKCAFSQCGTLARHMKKHQDVR